MRCAVKRLTLLFLFTIGVVPAQAQLRTEVVASGFTDLVAYVPDPIIPGVFYAVQQHGLVRVVQHGVISSTPFLDLRTAISAGGERGLLGMAFSPDLASHRVFVNFTNSNGHTVIARFRRSVANPLVADPAARLDLVWPNEPNGQLLPYIIQPYANHNGGHLAFGPDEYLYIGMGDGGSGDDPENRAQNPWTLLGKMLRVDVEVPDSDPRGYRIPTDNPFVDGIPIPALGEIWDFGLRNPWRYTFDDPSLGGTGALFIGDVGQSAREEVNYEPARSGGRNFGWRMREGTIATPGVPATTPAFTPLIEPLFDYPRSIGTTVTAGYVYRGQALGQLYRSRFFVADFGSERVFSVSWAPIGGGAAVTSVLEHTAELGTLGPISSFAVDLAGELYILIHGSAGRVLRIVRDVPPPAAPSNLTYGVSGRTVTLLWTGSAGTTQYRVEVGSQSGFTNLAQFDTASAVTSLSVGNAPDGNYYVRVRAIGPGGVSGPGNEVLVTVGPCTGPPPAPTGFTFTRDGRFVSVAWLPAGGLTGLQLEVGSAPGVTNLVIPLDPASSGGAGNVSPGTYYVRLRAMNACGSSLAQNELAISVP
jgi:glucose/arabinose dehydrogenase